MSNREQTLGAYIIRRKQMKSSSEVEAVEKVYVLIVINSESFEQLVKTNSEKYVHIHVTVTHKHIAVTVLNPLAVYNICIRRYRLYTIYSLHSDSNICFQKQIIHIWC